MAALTGTLGADFSEFLTAVESAETKLKGFQTDAGKVESALNRMTNAFSGTKILQEATIAVEAVERIGGASKLTEQEQARVNAIVEEAIAKYTVLGQTAPPAMVQLAAATAKTEVATTGLGGALTTTTPGMQSLTAATVKAEGAGMSFQAGFLEVNKALSAVGVNLGPIPAALDQLSSASARAGSNLSTMAQGGLVVGAALAGWNIGRWIADTYDLDKQIAAVTAELMGWGSVMEEEAAAKADVLARATSAVGYAVTDVDTAVKLLAKSEREATEASKQHTADLKEKARVATEAAEKLEAFSDRLFSFDLIDRAEQYLEALGSVSAVTLLTAEKKKELHGVMEAAIEAYAAFGDTAPAEMQAVFAATTELLEVTRSFGAASSGVWVQFAAGVEDGKTRMAEIAEAAKLHWSDIGGVSRETLEQVAADAKEQYELALAHSENFTGKQIANFRKVAAEAQAAVEAWGTDTIEAYDAIEGETIKLAASFKSVTEEAKLTADAVTSIERATMSWSEAMDAVRRGEGTMGGTISGPVTASQNEIQRAYDEYRYWGPVVNRNAGNPRGTGPDWAELKRMGMKAMGGPVAAGMPYLVGERGSEVFIPSQSGTILPHGAPVGGAITINISTVMGNATEIARLVSSALVDAARARGDRLPVGA